MKNLFTKPIQTQLIYIFTVAIVAIIGASSQAYSKDSKSTSKIYTHAENNLDSIRDMAYRYCQEGYFTQREVNRAILPALRRARERFKDYFGNETSSNKRKSYINALNGLSDLLYKTMNTHPHDKSADCRPLAYSVVESSPS